MTKNTETVGVAVMRSQVDSLHKGHRALIEYVKERHTNTLIVVGVPPTFATNRNPLPYDLRRDMIQKAYPDVTIVPQPDCRSDYHWSETLDALIKEAFPGCDAILYGSRDSFRSRYHGEFETEFVPEVKAKSGTHVRKRAIEKPLNNASFRRGVIYGVLNRPPITYPTVDVGIYRKNTEPTKPRIEVLLGRKPLDPERRWRFIGGFVDKIDASYESAARREGSEESGDLDLRPFEYVCSSRIEDWRYRGTNDTIMTILFRAQYIFGYVEPGDDIEEVRWFALEQIPNVLVDEHKPLGEKYIESFAGEATV